MKKVHLTAMLACCGALALPADTTAQWSSDADVTVPAARIAATLRGAAGSDRFSGRPRSRWWYNGQLRRRNPRLEQRGEVLNLVLDVSGDVTLFRRPFIGGPRRMASCSVSGQIAVPLVLEVDAEGNPVLADRAHAGNVSPRCENHAILARWFDLARRMREAISRHVHPAVDQQIAALREVLNRELRAAATRVRDAARDAVGDDAVERITVTVVGQPVLREDGDVGMRLGFSVSEAVAADSTAAIGPSTSPE